MYNGGKREQTDIRFELLCAGYCTHREKMTLQTGSWQQIRIPALFGLIHHPTAGPILFDTGYAEHFEQACSRFPYSLYKRVTPVTFRPEEGAAAQLRARGIQPEDVRHIILSHFHADHVAGCADFPNATFYCFRSAYEFVKEKQGLAAVRYGFVPSLLPPDFANRAVFLDTSEPVELPDELEAFDAGYDVLGDGSLIAIEMSGHAVGQFGLYFRTASGEQVLLCADAVWSSKAYREAISPHLFAYWLFPDRSAYNDTLSRLHLTYKCYPQVTIIPSHCGEWWEQVKKGWE
ncbi:MBL fold metallo-hydrolase [Brevibacillus fluminis]|uniref:MBL fold metallo-hydrolase n=1 Tax=Brevibacillus fluminis TaxID=511487 RepID=UPI003F8C394B